MPLSFQPFRELCVERRWSWNIDYCYHKRWEGPPGQRRLQDVGWRFTIAIANDQGSIELWAETLEQGLADAVTRMERYEETGQ